MFTCNTHNRPMKQPFGCLDVIVSEQRRKKEGLLSVLKEALHHTVTSFIHFGKCAYFSHKGSSQQRDVFSLDLSPFLEA